jgi:beta-arrestin
MYAPSKQGEQPSVEVSKEFMMSPNKLHLEASLDKELYYHGETVAVNVHIQNNSNKSVKKVKVSGKSSIFFFSVSSYSKVVDHFPSISVIFLQNSSSYFHFNLNHDILFLDEV